MRAEKKPAELLVERLEVGVLQTNCYILKSGEEVVVIDPGGDGDTIIDRVQKLGGSVKWVINTHGHIDHIGANAELIAATGAELLIHHLDASLLLEPEGNLSLLMGAGVRSPVPNRLLNDGEELPVGEERLRVVHTPGHTPGSICLLGDGYVFTGDTLFLDSIGRVDFPGGSERQMRNSLVILQGLLRRETLIYPGHGPVGSFGRALLVNPFLGGGFASL